MMTESTLPLIERYLDLASARQTLVASNMANIDTPGYQTRDIDFRAELVRLTEGDTATPVARTVHGLVERPDGNNVSLDRESLVMAETQIQYNLGVQLIRKEFQRLLTAINEGRQG